MWNAFVSCVPAVLTALEVAVGFGHPAPERNMIATPSTGTCPFVTAVYVRFFPEPCGTNVKLERFVKFCAPHDAVSVTAAPHVFATYTAKQVSPV